MSSIYTPSGNFITIDTDNLLNVVASEQYWVDPTDVKVLFKSGDLEHFRLLKEPIHFLIYKDGPSKSLALIPGRLHVLSVH